MVNIDIFSGPVAAPVAITFWNNLDVRARRAICWDVDYAKRPGYLQMSWFNADYVALVFGGDRNLAAAWATRIAPRATCAMIHFCFARPLRRKAVEIGKDAIRALWKETDLQSFVGIIPACYGHAIRYVEKLGFRRGASLCGACAMWPERLADGVLVTLNRGEL